MGIAVKAERGGLVETLAGAPRAMILRNGEIERFEDHYPSGIFAAWDGFFQRAPKPTVRQVRDLVALGLVGGGMDDAAADKLVADLGPEHNLTLYSIAQGLVGVAFMPDLPEDGEAPDASAEGDGGKKTQAAPGMCGE